MVRASQSSCVVIGLLLANIIVLAVQAQQADTASIGKFPALESETLEKQYFRCVNRTQGEPQVPRHARR